MHCHSRRWQACGLALLLLCCALSAHAIIREVDPRDMPGLKPDEGLLVVAIDSDVDSPAIRINREGVNLDLRKVRGKGTGHSYRLYTLPAGRYRWSAVIHAFTYDIPKDPEFTFEVKPEARSLGITARELGRRVRHALQCRQQVFDANAHGHQP